MSLPEFLQYDFMLRALTVGVFTAISTAMLGNFVVASRQAVVSDMLAHTALVGVGLGIFWNVSPSLLAFITTIIASLLLWSLSRNKSQAPEAISMLLLTGGLALALLLTHLNKDNPVSLDTYLFGSILTITKTEMYWFIGLNILIITTLITFWKSFLSLVFDSDFLQTQKPRIIFELILMLMISLMVGIGLKVIGGLLIGALLVIPVLIAQNFSQSFVRNAQISIGANLVAIVIGIASSFYLDIPTSSGIVLSLVGILLITKIVQNIRV